MESHPVDFYKMDHFLKFLIPCYHDGFLTNGGCNGKAVREREGVLWLYAGGLKHFFEGIADRCDWKAGQNKTLAFDP